jgi:hypothetical protein
MKEKEKTMSGAISMEIDFEINPSAKAISQLKPVRTLLIPRFMRGIFMGKSYFWQHFIL